MNSLRKIVGFLMVLMLAAFALPSGAAPAKLFNAVIPTFITSSSVKVTFNNTSPGNSTINSLSIAVTGNVSISATNCANNTLGTGTLTGGACVITNFSGIGSNASKTFQLPITFLSGATCANATWVVNANTGNAYPQGTPFTPIDQQYSSSCDAVLGCANEPASGSSTFDDGTVFMTRYSNKDGSACVATGIDFTDLIVTNTNTIHQVWDTNTQPNAVFTYFIPWKPVWVQSNGLPKPTQVAWTEVNNLPQYVDARFCLTPTVPAPSLGTLAAAITSTAQTSITVNPGVSLPATPFPITIDTERMQVTSTGTGSNWTVTRGAGGTPKTAHSQYYADNVTAKKVMTTPLPLDGDGVTGNQMRMCILKQEVTTQTPDKCPSPAPAGPPACVQINQTLLDEGDGWASSE